MYFPWHNILLPSGIVRMPWDAFLGTHVDVHCACYVALVASIGDLYHGSLI